MKITSLVVAVIALMLSACSTPPKAKPQTVALEPACAQNFGKRNLGKYSLALSGGGYRAMLFHVGSLWRLHELGLLHEVSEISSVSGGSIVSGVLALQIGRLDNDMPGGSECYRSLIAEPIMHLAKTTIDWKAAAGSLVSTQSAGNVLAGHYQRDLFGDLTLSSLPANPSFVFQSTNFHTGAVWSFARESMGDPQTGYTDSREMPLADAIAASSAFPPVLSPYRLTTKGREWYPYPKDNVLTYSREYAGRRGQQPTAVQSFYVPTAIAQELRQSEILLTDGGVADNLGLEGIWFSPKNILVSDGGAHGTATKNPPTGWIGQLAHITALIHTQPSQLRYHMLIKNFKEAFEGGRDGAFWAASKKLPQHREDCYQYSPRVDDAIMTRLSDIPTRLSALSDIEIRELINFGYHITDWGIPYLNERMAGPLHSISARLPFPDAPLWLKPVDYRACGGSG